MPPLDTGSQLEERDDTQIENEILMKLKPCYGEWKDREELRRELDVCGPHLKKLLKDLELRELVYQIGADDSSQVRITIKGIASLSKSEARTILHSHETLLASYVEYYSNKAGSIASLYLATLFGIFALIALAVAMGRQVFQYFVLPYLPVLLQLWWILIPLMSALLISGAIFALQHFWYTNLASNAIGYMSQWKEKRQGEAISHDLINDIHPRQLGERSYFGGKMYNAFYYGFRKNKIRMVPLIVSYFLTVFFVVLFFIAWPQIVSISPYSGGTSLTNVTLYS